MDLPELEELIARGVPGTNALVEITRNGQLMQVYVPRGQPVGVAEVPPIEVRIRELEAERPRAIERISSLR